jgi:hypothetical protein
VDTLPKEQVKVHETAVVAEMQIEEQSERRTKHNFLGSFRVGGSLPSFLLLTLLPWFLAVLFTASISASLQFLVYVGMVLAIGYAILSTALSPDSRSRLIVLAPALGIIVIEAISGVWLRLGMAVQWLPWVWILLGVAGVPLLWKDRHSLWVEKIPWGGTLAVISALSCLIFFLPSAKNDSVLRKDGSFQWIYVDAQYNYAIAAGIKGGVTPPTGPGTATEPLYYHFGPYATAAAISRFDGLNLGDALMRVMRGASIWALLLSCFGFGTLLARRCGGDSFGGLMSVVGLFFYGSLLSLFSRDVNGPVSAPGAFLFKIPGVEVMADGGPFAHLILGHSELHGLVAITGVMALFLATLDHSRSRFILAILPALVIPVNSVPSLYCFGIGVILLSWGRLRAPRLWLELLIMAGVFFTVWRIMGYEHTSDAALASLNRHPGAEWWMIAVGFLIGLGFRIIAFASITNPLKDPLAAIVLVTTVGLLSFYLFLKLGDGNQHYGIYYLQCMLSIFAFSRLKFGFWHLEKLRELMQTWFRIAVKGMLVLTLAAFGLGLFTFVSHGHIGMANFPLKIAMSTGTLLILAAAAALVKQHNRAGLVVSSGAAAVLLFGFCAWITPWLDFGQGRLNDTISVSPGEVQGLERLRELAAPGERFATNQHSLDQFANHPMRSYEYSALSERPVLVEGYEFRADYLLPWFPSMLHDNDLMFTTRDPAVLQDVASRWGVHWLVARPGTDISLAQPLPSWLIPQSDAGSLKIYQIK